MSRTPDEFERFGPDVVVDANASTPPRRPTGQEIFDSLSKAEQDEMLGPAAAEKVRQGEAALSDFVMEEGGFIKQRPVEDV